MSLYLMSYDEATFLSGCVRVMVALAREAGQGQYYGKSEGNTEDRDSPGTTFIGHPPAWTSPSRGSVKAPLPLLPHSNCVSRTFSSAQQDSGRL